MRHMQHSLLVSAILVLSLCQYIAAIDVLFPDRSLNNQEILPPASRQFVLRGLQANSHYEVRVSYPSAVPANIELEFARNTDHTTARKLLNTEKIMFRTDTSGRVVVCTG